MGFLNPLFLFAGLAIGVPVFLHLFHRQKTRRLSFPALRYLERTEREHAREIRIRQLLLLSKVFVNFHDLDDVHSNAAHKLGILLVPFCGKNAQFM